MLYQILDRVMKRADSAQVTMSRSDDVPVVFQDDKLKSIKVDQATDIDLRVIVDGKSRLIHPRLSRPGRQGVFSAAFR